MHFGLYWCHAEFKHAPTILARCCNGESAQVITDNFHKMNFDSQA